MIPKLPSRERIYFAAMKWSKFHTNGCDLICTNRKCDQSYVSYLDNEPKFCTECGSRLWTPDPEY